ncbi:MAG: sigma-54 dependent transcriptional regulator [Pseudomonadota bacterium]
MSAKILIVDDEEDIRALIRGILEDESYTVIEAANSSAAFEMIDSEDPDLIILDIWLQGSEKDGMEILESLQSRDFYIPTLMISGHGTIETAVSAIKKGAYDFIEKPFKSDRLLMMITRALETAKLKKENKVLKSESLKKKNSLIGKTDAMKNLQEQITKIAPGNSRVLIKGEAGTGKEVVAREIHCQSPRQDKVFMALNCAALHPERLEQELFGVENKDEQQKGVLALADGGTLFLDEVLDMPLETQGKILRVLEENAFEPVGSHKAVKTDVRVIASTNQDVEQAVKDGHFREDLLYRLNVVTLELPTLPERSDDIALLATHFLQEFVTNKEVSLTKDAKESLKQYQWPGNVRQLRNVMEWVAIMNNFEGDTVKVEKTHLPPEITGVSAAQNTVSVSDGADYTAFPLREARENFEKNYLTMQIRRFDGNVSQAAKFIGMERSALHRKLKSLDISPDDAQNGSGQNKEVA